MIWFYMYSLPKAIIWGDL